MFTTLHKLRTYHPTVVVKENNSARLATHKNKNMPEAPKQTFTVVLAYLSFFLRNNLHLAPLV